MRSYFDDKESMNNSISREGMKSWRFSQHTANTAHGSGPTSDLLSLCSPCKALSHTGSFVGCIFHCSWNLEWAFLVQTTEEHFWGYCEKEIKNMRRYIQGHLLQLFFFLNGRTLANLHIYFFKKRKNLIHWGIHFNLKSLIWGKCPWYIIPSHMQVAE